MIRLLAFALHASEYLAFGRGVSTDMEPDLWQKNALNDIELWIDLGQADEKRLRRAGHQAQQVILYTYQTRAAEIWWKQNKNKLKLIPNFTAYNIHADTVSKLTKMAQRNMQLQYTIEDGHIWLNSSGSHFEIQRQQWQ